MTIDQQILTLVNNSTMSIRQISENISEVNRSTITVHVRKLRKWGDVVPIRSNEKRRGMKGFVYTSKRRFLG